MNDRYLIVYKNEDDEFRFRIIERDRITHEFYSEGYRFKENIECNLNQIVVHKMPFNQNSNIFDPKDVPEECLIIKIITKDNIPLYKGIDFISEENLTNFYDEIKLQMNLVKQLN